MFSPSNFFTRKTTVIFLLSMLVFLLLLVIKMPASQLLYRLPLPENIVIAGAQGSIWNGSIKRFAFSQFSVNNVKWKLSPKQLLTAKLVFSVQGGGEQFDTALGGYLIVSLGKIEGRDIEVITSARHVFEQLNVPLPATAEGEMTLNIDQIILANQQCSNLSGQGVWDPARLIGDVIHTADFGRFEVDLSCEPNRLLARISKSNVLNLRGTAWFSNRGEFGFNGEIKPQAHLPIEVHKAAYLFGSPDAQGVFTIDI